MRKRKEKDGVSVHAISGTEVVLLGLNVTEEVARNLLGFHILKQKDKTGEFRPLNGGRDFKGIKSKTPVIQSFQWSDYVVDQNKTYTYRIIPVYDNPESPRKGTPLDITITTEDPEGQVHAVYFNRGVAGSQAFSYKFDKYRKWYKNEAQEEDPQKMEFTEFIKPRDVEQRKAYRWLSRGLEEAMLGFISQARGPQYSIRAAVYEFTYLPAIQAFVDALERGVDVKIIHHAKRKSLYRLRQNYKALTKVEYTGDLQNSVTYKNREVTRESSGDEVCQAAHEAISEIGIGNPDYLPAFKAMMIARKITQISHNKFIVLLKDNKPIQVWTGSTNFTAGGIFGQSNVGHIVRDANVAQKYMDYWEKLSTDPKKKSSKSDPPDKGLQNWTVQQQPDLEGPPPPNSITPLFSPRLTKAMLDWYAERMDAARNSVFFTAAFTVADEIYEKAKEMKKVQSGKPFLRYLLLEGITGLMKKKYRVMSKCSQNRIAWGDKLRRGSDDEERKQFIETLTGLNDHVNYLHTKYMLIDPLSDDPIVITGSANFSEASTTSNDENMLIIRGNTRVADIFLVEFMRLFNHFKWRNEMNKLSGEEAKEAMNLCPDDSWTKPYYEKDTPERAERILFS